MSCESCPILENRLFQKLEISIIKKVGLFQIKSKDFQKDLTLYVENQKFQNFKGRLLL